MRTQKTKHKGFLGLNGNTGSVAICLFITTQILTGYFNAGGLSKEVKELGTKITSLTSVVETNRKEAREDLKALEQQFYAQRLIKKSA